MAVRGVFTSDSHIVGNRPGDFASGLLQIMPEGNAPLLALSSGMETANASDVIVTWFEENHMTGRVLITNNAGTGTSIVVDDGTFVTGGMIFMIEATGEYVLVTGVSGGTLTVIRGQGSTSIQAVDGSVTPKAMQRIGTAFEEGSNRPVGVANLGYPRFNYMQIFRNAWDITGTARVVDTYTGDTVAKNKKDCAMLHAEDIERSMFFAKRQIAVVGSKPMRMMDGIVSQISTNVTSQSTNVTWWDIDDFLQSVFTRNIKGKPNERIAFCGNSVVSVLNRIAQLEGEMNIEPGETEFGLKIMRWMTPYGDISLMRHPLLVESPFWTKNLYIFHPGAIRTRWLRRTFEDNYDSEGRRAGVDADFGVMTSELSVEYRAEITGGIYTGIDTAASITDA